MTATRVVTFVARYRLGTDGPDDPPHEIAIHSTREGASHEWMQAKLVERVAGAMLCGYGLHREPKAPRAPSVKARGAR